MDQLKEWYAVLIIGKMEDGWWIPGMREYWSLMTL